MSVQILDSADIAENGFYTAAVGTDRVVVLSGFGESAFDSRQLIGITLGGVQMQEAVYENTSGGDVKGGIYYLLESEIPSGSQQVLADWGGNLHESVTGTIYTLSGVSQTAAVGQTVSSGNNTTNDISISVTTTDGSAILGCIGSNSAAMPISAAGTESNSNFSYTLNRNSTLSAHCVGTISSAVATGAVNNLKPRFSSVTTNKGSAALAVFLPISAGPTITGPDSTTEGAATTQTGTLLDTVVTQSLVSGSYSIEQTITSQIAGELVYTAESGVNLCTPPTPVSGVPLEATISAAGVTPYVVQQQADDGTNPPATRNITLNPEATHEVIQTMAGVANTTPDQSIFGSTLVTVEDNHQARVPKVVDGVTFTWFADGTFTTDIDKTVTFQYELFSPASGNWSCISLTVKDTSIIAVGMVTGMVASMVSNMVEDM